MLDISSHVEDKLGSERNFGIVFAIIFLIVSIWSLIVDGEFGWVTFVLSFVFFILAFAAPKALIVPNKLWFKFGMLPGATLSPVVMFLVYLATVIRTGFILKILGKDPLQQKMDHST